MPRYNYLCDDCGPFDEIFPLADFANPQPCPNCGYPAPRALSTAGLMGGGADDRGNSAKRAAAPHRSGCGCCGPVKGQPAKFEASALPRKARGSSRNLLSKT
jgi:putative FmdB family regulatory protein